ncbi:transporter substrate-binding domain-containing protein [Saccharopolyspora rosea]|uniref:Transporter substrate-binding domain-containing protein n=1 Tax=Saccharopolyspora rosea TaxID=524884 RepID=A0ABW3FSK3_9PSEU
MFPTGCCAQRGCAIMDGGVGGRDEEMRIKAFTAVLAAVAALSACGQDVPSEPNALPPQPRPAPASPQASADTSVELDTSPTIEQIKRRGRLLVGVRSDAPQFAQADPSGDYRGFDVEIARIIARGIGLNPDTQIIYRRLPPTLIGQAVSTESVNVLLGPETSATRELVAVGPYAVAADGGPRYATIKPGDDAMRRQLQQILDTAVADGSWQRAYDTTLAPAGVQARPK